jgi:phage-related protein
VRAVWNTENIAWDGETWYAFPFSLSDIEESKDAEIPEVSLTIFDIERRIIPLIDTYGGGIGASLWVRIVHSAYLDNNTPEFEHEFEIIAVSVGHDFSVKFTLGAENLSNKRSPVSRYIKGHCRYKEFKGNRCGYSGDATDCNRTFERCRELGNQHRFGGFPGVSVIGYWR